MDDGWAGLVSSRLLLCLLLLCFHVLQEISVWFGNVSVNRQADCVRCIGPRNEFKGTRKRGSGSSNPHVLDELLLIFAAGIDRGRLLLVRAGGAAHGEVSNGGRGAQGSHRELRRRSTN